MKLGNENIRTRSLFTFILISIFTVLAFQNCINNSGSNSTDALKAGAKLDQLELSQSLATSPGDGTGFEGKLHFYSLDIERCKKLGNTNRVISSELIDLGDHYQLVSKDCHDISPIQIPKSEMALVSLNQKILSYGGVIFEFRNAVPTIQTLPEDQVVVFCKGTWNQQGLFGIADGLLRQRRTSEANQKGGLVIESFVYGPRPVQEPFESKFIHHYKVAARPVLKSGAQWALRWAQVPGGSFKEEGIEETAYQSLSILKPEFYERSDQGQILNGFFWIPAPATFRPYFPLYSTCVQTQ